ncbi:MAG: insulinase family protein [Candidatus Riflebacteria bacterium]|nr:insulinase family protein [Candidatus Riflebacteria bacterium]
MINFAQSLAKYQQIWGDWRELFNEQTRIESVTQEDIMRVATKYFTRENRTVASVETEPAAKLLKRPLPMMSTMQP